MQDVESSGSGITGSCQYREGQTPGGAGMSACPRRCRRGRRHDRGQRASALGHRGSMLRRRKEAALQSVRCRLWMPSVRSRSSFSVRRYWAAG